MGTSRLPMLFVVAGATLIATSWLWPLLVGGRRAWTEQDAEQLEQATVDLHQLRGQYGTLLQSTPPDSLKSAESQQSPTIQSQQKPSRKAELSAITDKLAQTEERYRGLSAKLVGAQTGGFAAASAMSWIGVVLIAVGALGYYSMRSGSTT